MTNFDGAAESAAILAHAKTLFGGRVTEGLADDETIALNSDSTVKPFAAILFGEPIASGKDRNLGREATQPHIVGVSFVLTARDSITARSMSADILNLFMDWQPTPTSGLMLPVGGGAAFGTIAASNVPSRFVRMRNFSVELNL
ncbi:hypothetical protein [Frigoribacterium sp. UYMn621]|uniref:hypothetical protein n=1 Tax=Frigoribacterium sp. UYMn621 TaxID=3156343 RepID=UPI0033985B22